MREYDYTKTKSIQGSANSPGTGEKVTLEDAGFNRQYDVFAHDQIEVRYFLTPLMMERFKMLHRSYPSCQAILRQGQLYLMLPTQKDFFRPCGLDEAITLDFLDNVFSDLDVITDIAEDLKLQK